MADDVFISPDHRTRMVSNCAGGAELCGGGFPNTVTVSPAAGRWGRAGWLGSGPGQSAALAQATRTALTGTDPAGVTLSTRAKVAVAELRDSFAWLDGRPGSVVVQEPKGPAWWWTFAGTAANIELTSALGGLATVSTSGLAVRLTDGTTPQEVRQRLDDGGGQEQHAALPEDLAEVYKFADALPRDAAQALFDARERDPLSVARVIDAPIHAHRLRHAGPRP